MEEQLIRQVVAEVLARAGGSVPKNEVPVEISARHVHLSQKDVEQLFGAGYQLTAKRELSQPGQFLSEERVSLVTDKGVFRNVAVLGPARSHTQVELSASDARALGISAPLRLSGDTAGCPSMGILAGQSMIQAQQSTIVAQNHIHMTTADAVAMGVKDGQRVSVQIKTNRPITFNDVVVRVSDEFSLAMHIDFDEANACMLQCGDLGVVLP